MMRDLFRGLPILIIDYAEVEQIYAGILKSNVLEHGKGEVPINKARRDKFIERNELVWFVSHGERARADDCPRCADGPKVDEIARPLEALRVRDLGSVAPARSETRHHNRVIRRRLGRPASGRPIFDDVGANAGLLAPTLDQIHDLTLDLILVLARDHAAVEQKVAVVRQHVVGSPGHSTCDGKARLTDERMLALPNC